MSNYQFVNIRFNINKPDEKALFEKLDSTNRAGNIKNILKKFFLSSDVDFFKKTDLKEIIKEIIDNEMDIKKDKKIIQSDYINKSGIKIIVGGSEKQI